MRRISGFTLIELLIVVAIIAILAAIAVPNFLEAQVRSKVSRVKSDLRTMATAIEAYYIDFNVPPPEARSNFPANSPFGARTIRGQGGQTGIMGVALSTPIAYLTNSDLPDPFFSNDSGARPDISLFTYKAYDWEWSRGRPVKADNQGITFNEGAVLTGARFRELYGGWRLFSIGPDRDWDNFPDNARTAFRNPASVGLPYDPTNGTLSIGSIVRSQKEPDQRTWQIVAGQ